MERIYHAALARDERERAAFVREESGGDEDLARDVESLLSCDDDSNGFLHGQAIDVLANASVPDEIPEPLIGHQLGPYAITSFLGFGGMGDVYRARDTKLGRDVAVKILPEMFAADSGRRARFEREARVLASLNHPNIAAIYGFEDGGGLHALVLELVDGQTLHDRLQGGPLHVGETLTIAAQIASALEAAHAKGIVHRDLKPRNIALTRDGTVKVLDFGLAKATLEEADQLSSRDAQTRDGAIVGTTAYMSPEQARGLPADTGADIWAFGCVLVEMLIGRRVFDGATAPATIAAILGSEPAWTLPGETPPAIAVLARRCLEKERARRPPDITEVRAAIDDARRGVPPAPRRGRYRRWIGVAAALLAAAAVGLVFETRRTPVRSTHLSISVPGTLSPQLSATLSPDGRRLAFVATGRSGRMVLWIRELDSPEPRALDGTEDAAHPFWSPDGRFIGFLADGKVRTIGVDGGKVSTLADTPERAGPSWGRDGHIMFVSRPGELGIVSPQGGPVTTVVSNLPPGRFATWPHFLPDGRRFLFFMRTAKPEGRGIYAGSLDSTHITFVVESEFKGAYADGHLLYVRGHELLAQPFDATRLALLGAPIHVADGIWSAMGAGQASFSASNTGALAYVNAAVSYLRFAWFDRNGRALEQVGGSAPYSNAPELSPDGSRVLVTRGEALKEQIWSIDTVTEKTAQISTGPGRSTNPVWSPDGTRVAYQTSAGLVVKNADGSGPEDLVLPSDRLMTLTDWSIDDRLVYAVRGPASLSDLWLLPLNGARRPIPYLETAFNKTQAQVSPDGRWIAYTSYESGRDEVYVDRFPERAEKRKVSTAGGVQPRWRKDGAELYYVAPDSRMIAVAVDTRTSGLAESPLFKTRLIPHGSQSVGLFTLYDVSPDGRRFLCFTPSEESGSPISVILNFTAALRRR